MKTGVISILYPTKALPSGGIFIKDELEHLAGQVSVKLLSPINIVRGLSRANHFIDSREYPIKRPFVLGYPRWPLRRFYPLSVAASILFFGRSFLEDCDVIHAHMAYPDGVAASIAYSGKKPLVVTVHGSDINHFAFQRDLNKLIVDAMNRVDVIICVSNALSKRVRELGIETPTEVIPNGIDTVMFSPAEKTECCARLNLDPDRPRILFAGNFVPVKGIPYLLGAMPEVLKKFPDCELILLGAKDGTDDRIKYLPEIEKLGIDNNVKIFSAIPHDEIPLFMNAADCFALPSIKEGFGLVAAESLACGIPVVSTVSGGPEDIVTDGMGKLVKPGDSQALAESLINVLSGNGIRSREEIKAYAFEKFSFESVIRKIVGVYESVTNNKHTQPVIPV